MRHRSLLLSTLAVLAFAAIAALLIHVIGADYGATLFVLLPMVAGFLAAVRASSLVAASQVFGAALVIGCIGLLISGLEGLVCVALALPLVFLAALFGALVARLLRRWRGGPGGGNGLSMVLAGLLLIGCGAGLERPVVQQAATESVVTIQQLAHPPAEVWQALLAFQRVEGDKPWLLKLGLPVPLYCTIDGSGVGARRVCHFDQGVIEERIETWDPPRELGLRITRVTLPGRDWLRFVDASYQLRDLGNGQTELLRSTRHASVLRPRFYWRPLEALGTDAEHRYLFSALRHKLGSSAAAN